MDDWQLHLTTLFPEVRLKRYIEIRSADSQAPERLMALPALVKGVFYEADCLDAAFDMVKRWTFADVAEAYRDVVRVALDARVKGIRVAELAHELYEIAAESLRRQAVRDAAGADERCYLDPVAEIVASGRPPACTIAEQWTGPVASRLTRLVDATAYRTDRVPRS
jgi:glutamate--cysteine ligase